MALSGAALASLVYADHLSVFPLAASATRSNATTGVLLHNPPQEFITCLCNAVVSAALSMTICDNSIGATGPPPGTATPAVASFPGAPAAAAELIASEVWVGISAYDWAAVCVESVLTHLGSLATLQMNPNPYFGTGTGVVSAAANGHLLAAMEGALNGFLITEFGTCGYFSEGDVPTVTTPTAELLVSLPSYASAIATGFATITANIVYAGASTPANTATGVNSGVLL